jgi:hypothetical protein
MAASFEEHIPGNKPKFAPVRGHGERRRELGNSCAVSCNIAGCCELFPLKGFFGSRKAHLLRMAVAALRHLPFAWSSGWFPGTHGLFLDGNVEEEASIAYLENSASALVTFTSGSTGQPKAALRSHGFLLAQHGALAASIGLRAVRESLHWAFIDEVR